MKHTLIILLAWMSAYGLVGDPISHLLNQCSEKQLVTACLVMEAGGEGAQGMQAVMNVIVNRAGGLSGRYFAEVTRPKQFSCLNDQGSVFWHDFSGVIAKAQKSSSWKVAAAVVEKAYKGELADLTQGATHYYATTLKKAPEWAGEMDETFVWRKHRFLRGGANDPVVKRAKLTALARN